VDEYNASLPAIVSAQQAAGHRVTLVEMNQAVGADDLLPDGVHPGPEGMRKMAATWFRALRTAGYVQPDIR
jgi:lysophospholipase L1-like esterase